MQTRGSGTFRLGHIPRTAGSRVLPSAQGGSCPIPRSGTAACCDRQSRMGNHGPRPEFYNLWKASCTERDIDARGGRQVLVRRVCTATAGSSHLAGIGAPSDAGKDVTHHRPGRGRHADENICPTARAPREGRRVARVKRRQREEILSPVSCVIGTGRNTYSFSPGNPLFRPQCQWCYKCRRKLPSA
jgi:hypothetical protein